MRKSVIKSISANVAIGGFYFTGYERDKHIGNRLDFGCIARYAMLRQDPVMLRPDAASPQMEIPCQARND